MNLKTEPLCGTKHYNLSNSYMIKCKQTTVQQTLSNQSHIIYSHITNSHNCYFSFCTQNASKFQGIPKIVLFLKILKEHLAFAPFQSHVIFCLIQKNCHYYVQNAASFLPKNSKLASGLPALLREDKWRTPFTIKSNTPNKQNYSPTLFQLLK